MQRDTDGALEVDTLNQRVQSVADQFRDIPFTGSLTAPDSAILHRVLHADPTPQPPAVAAAAVKPALDSAKQAPRKSQPRQALPTTVQPAATSLPLGPKPGQGMCDLGSKCRRTTLARDPKDPSKTVFVTRCAMWHNPTEFPDLMRTIRAEFDAASSVSPAPPVAMPVPAVGSPAVPGRIPQADIIKAFIASQRPAKPSLPAVRPGGPRSRRSCSSRPAGLTRVAGRRAGTYDASSRSRWPRPHCPGRRHCRLPRGATTQPASYPGCLPDGCRRLTRPAWRAVCPGYPTGEY